MSYYISLSSIKLEDYKEKLKSEYLIPSRMILKENIDIKFDYFQKIGIDNLFDLQKNLKNKMKFSELSKADCLSEEYLTILLREINSIQPKPNKIKEFSGISTEIVLKLERIGIKDTLKLFDYIKNHENRKDLSVKIIVNLTEILELTKLTDLSRIKWVGTTFARVLYETGYDTVGKVSKADFEILHKKILEINKELNLYKGQIGLNDIKLCVNSAKELPLDINYTE